VPADPPRQRFVAQPSARDDRVPRDVAVRRQVVARHHRERRTAGPPPAVEGLDQVADGARRLPGLGGSCLVGAARDRQGDHGDARVDKRGKHRFPFLWCMQVARDRADDARLLAARPAGEDGVEAVLGRQRLVQIGPAQPDADDAPVANAARREVVEVDRLMGPVERADAQVNDTRPDGGAVIGRHRDARGMVAKRVVSQRGRWGQAGGARHGETARVPE
jgi:hypothetical protein